MAKKTLDMEVEKEGGGLGRFLFIATPILFTLVLVGAIIMLFNVDLRNSMFSTLDKIPIVKNWIPSADNSSTTAASTQDESNSATVDQLKKDLAASQKTQTDQAQQIKDLQSKLTSQSSTTGSGTGTGAATGGTTGTTNSTGTTGATSGTTTSTVQTEQDKQLKNLANVYADMSSSKAAAIMQNMTTDEQVLIFSKMNSEAQAGILQKMDAKVAAETSLALKNATTASLALLQSKTSNPQTPATPSTSMSVSDMAQTFTTMPANSAASLLLQTAKVSQTKVLQVLNTMDDTTRASVLSAMSTSDPATTAQIVNRLLAN
ncbi:MotE family protein [Paenibacillus sp. WLX2291]|uniref:MotE family protein n=1 Tax=Paenibacillus sp. WLX2291 TaxID=3296934 RepID=UPI0039844613